MIRYSLRCGAGCAFEGWFGSMADYDRQAADKSLVCPVCGGDGVEKAPMAPAVATSERRARTAEMRAMMMDAAGKARAYIEKNFDYVGERFPEEARAIHYGEKEDRRIYGEASGDEVKALIDEGVPVAPAPGFPAKEKAGPVSPAPARAKPTLN